jgi:hypothetical protein
MDDATVLLLTAWVLYLFLCAWIAKKGDNEHCKVFGNLIEIQDLNYMSMYLTKSGRSLRFVLDTDSDFTRDIPRELFQWPKRIQMFVWHDIIFDSKRIRIIAMTRNTYVLKCDVIKTFLPSPIADLIMSYALRKLKIHS